ncbi:MAG: CHAT domain-containing protein [Acidobacteria bacterium]|nr:CHAT domain-containing protein [Acidobacteriota bacterium]
MRSSALFLSDAGFMLLSQKANSCFIRFRPTVCAVALLLTMTAFAQEQAPMLLPGQTIERQLRGGEVHSFQVRLQAGDFLRVSAMQMGIDIQLCLFDPANQKLSETDGLNGSQGAEVAAVIAEQSGVVRIEIAADAAVPPGNYQLAIETLRPATETDQQWMAAHRLSQEAVQLRAKPGLENQELAVAKFADALRIWQVIDDPLMVAHTLFYLASGYRRMGQTQHALIYYSYLTELARVHPQWRELPSALSGLANVMLELGEQRKALVYLNQVLGEWREFNDAVGEAQTLVVLGTAYTQIGESRQALAQYDQALKLWRQLNNRSELADALLSLGLTYDNLGEWQKSLEASTQARGLYQQINNPEGEAVALNNLGLVYVRLGEFDRALDLYRQAISLWRKLGDRREEANTLSNLGFAEAQQNNLAKALSAYQQSLPLWRQAGDRRGEARALQRLGELQAQLGESKKALEYFQQALPLFQTAGDRLREAETLTSLGKVILSQSDVAKAKEQFTLATSILKELGNRAGEAQALFGLAQTERKLGRLEESRRLIESALTNVETVRAEVGSQQFRTSYLATVQRLYEFNLDLLMQLHRAQPAAGFEALALQASERARARSLLEQLVESRADIRHGVDATLLARERELLQLLNAKAQRLSQLSPRTGDNQRRELQQEIRQLEDEYQQVQAKIRQTSPQYAALTQPQPLSAKEIQSLLDADTLLLEYALGEERSYLWAVSADGVVSYELPKRSLIEDAAKRTSKLLSARAVRLRGESAAARNERIAQADAQLSDTAKQLSDWLLAPAAALLGNKRLLIVPDGALQYVPFSMLPINPQSAIRNPQSEEPLVVKHELVMLPSASTLAVMRRELAGRPPAPKQLAIFADPVFDENDDRLKAKTALKGGQKTDASSSSAAELIASQRSIVHEDPESQAAARRLMIPRLPFTRQEAERILATMPTGVNSGANLKATGFNASRALATSAELGQYRYLHFATHGVLDTERADLSALLLSLVDESGKPQDGFLRAYDIYNLSLSADLVVLSACQTGLGKDYKGEGLVGLTRGFMYAGAARVVVSLWNVNDRATSELMAKFYQKMLPKNADAGERPAAALRSAQIEMWKQKQWSAPYYWAAFVLQGEWK